MTLKRVLLTGAGGFVGSALCRRLLADGHEVHAPLKTDTDAWRIADVLDEVSVHRLDLRDELSVRTLVHDVSPEVVYHLATHGAYSSQGDADGIIQTNILGTFNLLKALARTDYEGFVNTGSSSEYGFKDYAMRETDVIEPNSYYAVAKCAQTLLCQHVAKSDHRPITTFRLFSVYGPFEEPTRLVPTIIGKCLQGTDLTLVPPETARDFVYVDDVVDAYLCLDEISRLSGEIINIGTGVQTTVRQVVESVIRQTGARVRCRWGAMANRVWDAKTWVADCTKSGRLLRWRPRTGLDEGLGRTIDWMRERHA